jgi:hypothetical protein
LHPPPRQRGRGTARARAKRAEGGGGGAGAEAALSHSRTLLILAPGLPATITTRRGLRPLHHGSLATRAPVVPLPRYRGGGKKSDLVLAMHPHPSFPHERQDCCCLQIKRREAERRKAQFTGAASFGCGARLAIGALAFRRSTAALTEVSRPRLFGFRPGFLGRGPQRHYPPCACPSPAEAPRAPAVIPADMMPEAARERFARPHAGTAPAPHLRSHPECALRWAG